MAATYRIFLSSPSDVEDERLAVQRVVDLINESRLRDQPRFELFRWEEQFYTADSSFQDQVVQPADCDLVICVFWKRLGSELPPNYQRPDGTTPTGSEFEFEQALSKATEAEPKTPDIFVYLKTAPVVFAEETMAIEVEQRQKLLSFWGRWFKSEQGHFTAAYQKFKEINEFEALIERNLRAWLKEHEPDGDWRGGSPFPGLRAYDVEDGDIFFGRSRDVARVRARLLANAASGPAILFISGASGAGKSSVLRAGLLASLIRPGGFAPHADFVHHIITTPAALGSDWAVRLAEALLANDAFGEALRQGDFDQAASLGAVLAMGGEAAMAPLRKALERMKAAVREGAEVAFALAIDQFEEVFQFAPEDVEAFGALLNDMAAISVDGARFIILASMRSDHRHRFDEVASLALLSGRDQVRTPDAAERFFDLAPPRPADLREIIVEPARVAGLGFGHDGSVSLASVIEAEATGEALPALQLLLFSLYEDRTDDELRFETYQRLGGVGGVMATTAETAYQAASPDAQAAFPTVLRALVAEGADGGGATARWADAEALSAGPAGELAEALKAAHLLRSEGQRLRVAHESLLSRWDRAADQIAADRRFFDIRARLGARAARWKAADAGQAGRMLLRDFDLEEGRALIGAWGEAQVAEAAPDAPGFIRASVRAAGRRSLTSLAGAAAVLMMITVGAVAAWMFREDAAAAAKEAAVRLEVGRANEALRLEDIDTALSASLAAFNLAETVETRSILAMAVNEASPHLVKTLGAPATALAWGDDGALIGIGDGEAWRAEPGSWIDETRPGAPQEEPILALTSGPGGWFGVRADGVVVSEGGVQASDTPALGLWRASQIALDATASGVDAALAEDFEGVVWSLRCPPRLEVGCTANRLPVPDTTAVALSGEDALVAAQRGDDGATLTTFSRGDGAALSNQIVAPEVEEFLSLAISPTDGRIAAGARNGSLFLTSDAETTVREIHSGDRPVTALAWSPAGDHLAANCDGYDICVFEADGRLQSRIIGHNSAIIWLGFSPDGAHIATLDDKDVARVWSVQPNRAAASGFALSHITDQRTTALAVEGGRAAAAYDDGAIRVWSALDTAPAMLAPIRVDRRDVISSMSLSADGALAAADLAGGVSIWRAPGADQPPDLHLTGVNARRLAFLADGRIAASTSDNGIALIDLDGTAERIEGTGPSPDGITGRPGGGFIVSNTAAAFPIFDATGAPAGSLGADIVDATLSASSLSAHPGGRWLAASRDDGLIRIYSLSQPTQITDLPILVQNSKFVAFSPDGAKLAALDAGDNLYVWTFDADQGAASPFLQLQALPKWGEDQSQGRKGHGLGWMGPDCLAIASLRRGVFQVCHDMTALRTRAGRLLGR